jgi:hypothetical protein
MQDRILQQAQLGRFEVVLKREGRKFRVFTRLPHQKRPHLLLSTTAQDAATTSYTAAVASVRQALKASGLRYGRR